MVPVLQAQAHDPKKSELLAIADGPPVPEKPALSRTADSASTLILGANSSQDLQTPEPDMSTALALKTQIEKMMMEYKTATGQDYMQPAQEPSLKLSCHFFQTLIWAYLLLVGSRIHSAPRRMPTTSLCKLQHVPKKCWHAWTRLSLMRRFLASYYGLRIAEIKQCLDPRLPRMWQWQPLCWPCQLRQGASLRPHPSLQVPLRKQCIRPDPKDGLRQPPRERRVKLTIFG